MGSVKIEKQQVSRTKATRTRTPWFVLGALSCAATGLASPPELAGMVPRSIVAAYFVAGPTPAANEVRSWSAIDLAGPVAQQAQQLGLLSLLGSKVRAWVDAIASGSILLKHPHAVVLFDIHARKRPDGGHELEDLRAALIAKVGASQNGMEQRIRHLLQTYTNSEETVLTRRTILDDEVFTIRDRRLPAWLTISWGRFGEYYVVGVGQGAFERIADTLAGRGERLQNDHWFARACSDLRTADSAFTLYLRLDELEKHVDAALMRKTADVLSALGLGGLQRGLFNLGTRERSVEVTAAIRRNGRDETRRVAGNHLRERLWPNVVPEDARRYVLLDLELGAALSAMTEACLVARSPRARRKQREFWSSIDEASGVSLGRDIYPHLGGPVVLHNFPRHALGLSIAWTIVTPIKGDATALRLEIDRWMDEARRILKDAGSVQLHRDDDGVWYTQLGLVGPAVTVTDRCVVVSFSPEAVRQIVATLDVP